jgi:hypothetical protein
MFKKLAKKIDTKIDYVRDRFTEISILRTLERIDQNSDLIHGITPRVSNEVAISQCVQRVMETTDHIVDSMAYHTLRDARTLLREAQVEFPEGTRRNKLQKHSDFIPAKDFRIVRLSEEMVRDAVTLANKIRSKLRGDMSRGTRAKIFVTINELNKTQTGLMVGEAVTSTLRRIDPDVEK